jgi:hypothetical protein
MAAPCSTVCELITAVRATVAGRPLAGALLAGAAAVGTPGFECAGAANQGCKLLSKALAFGGVAWAGKTVVAIEPNEQATMSPLVTGQSARVPSALATHRHPGRPRHGLGRLPCWAGVGVLWLTQKPPAKTATPKPAAMVSTCRLVVKNAGAVAWRTTRREGGVFVVVIS